jgi:hypothetical protein
MKITMNELRALIGAVLSEARKSKKSKKKGKEQPNRMQTTKPEAYAYDESFDFSNPLGAYNLYKSQGAAGWGPMTGPGPKVDDGIRIPPQKVNLGEGLAPDSEWARFFENKTSRKKT